MRIPPFVIILILSAGSGVGAEVGKAGDGGFNSFLGNVSSDASPFIFEFDHGAPIVATWDEGGRPNYAISLDGQRVDVVRHADYSLLLQYANFDPMAGEPIIDPALLAHPDASVFLVQFITQPIDAYRDALGQSGATIHHYIGNYAYLVTGDAAARAKVAALPFVRWVGPYHPAYRIEPYIYQNVLNPLLASDSTGASQATEARRYFIMMLDPGPAMKNRVAGAIQAMGGQIDKNIPDGFLIEATLTPQQLVAVAALDDVLYIDHWTPATEYLDNVRNVGGANYVESVAGYDGTGVRAEVMDSGLRMTHQAFQAHPPMSHNGTSGSTSHGTSVYGIVFGNGAGNASGKGLIPGAQGIFSSYPTLVNRYQHTGELVGAPYNAVFQTNSWGNCCYTSYTTNAADMDLNLFDHDILLLQAQANEGSTNSDIIAFAKNLVSVGGVRHFNTASLTDDAWSGAGSIGPASDGRIKPDLSFWYDSILTTSSTSNTSYTSSFGGTSAATPITAGHFGLFFQMWSDGIFGNPVAPGASVFDNRPHMSTSKAMMINACSPYNFTGAAADLTRVHQGWGRADVKRLYDRAATMFIVNETDVLQNLATRSYPLEVAAGETEFRATLVYTDPPGVPASSQHRVNDLTLKVTSPTLAVYWGNSGMTLDNVTTPGGLPNTKDTVENVWVANPAAGTWIVEVLAPEIVQDAHVETPETDADYALVVSGVLRVVADGDMNCDTQANGDDIAPFVTALLDLATYSAQYPTCNVRRGDFHGDAVVSTDDVAAFVDSILAD